MTTTRLTYPDIARLVGTGLISTGAGLLIFVLITVAWGDPFTYLSERGAQQDLAAEIHQTIGGGTLQATTAGADRAAATPAVICSRANRFRRSIDNGNAAGRMRISAIGINKYVVKGARVPDLVKGPGFYKETAFPGCGMPVAIAGHRTTHGAPFLNIDRLAVGDPIVIDMPYGRFTYRVAASATGSALGGTSAGRVITPTTWDIINVGAAQSPGRRQRAWMAHYQRTGGCPVPGGSCEHLVLTACHPKYSARQRLAVFAVLDRVQLREATSA